MKLIDIWTNLSVGGALSILIIAASLIEITPIKLSPLKWIGKRINSELEKELKETTSNINKVESKLDEHIAQSLRTKILSFMDDILNRGMQKTRSQWSEIIKACAEYERYIEENDLVNGDATEAIEFLHEEYQRCLQTRNFLDVKLNKN